VCCAVNNRSRDNCSGCFSPRAHRPSGRESLSPCERRNSQQSALISGPRSEGECGQGWSCVCPPGNERSVLFQFDFSGSRLTPWRQAIFDSCRDVAQLYSMRLQSGDMAHIRQSPGHSPGLRIFEIESRRRRDRWRYRCCPNLEEVVRKIFASVYLGLSPISGAVAETATAGQNPLCYYHGQLYSPGAVICITKSYWQQCDGVNWAEPKGPINIKDCILSFPAMRELQLRRLE
jgi:hypothetical protein